MNYQIPEAISCLRLQDSAKKPAEEAGKPINVVCVKWGTRYGCEYVSKLYRGIMKNTKRKIRFCCFTDNGKGLSPDIEVRPLLENWERWWGKATLFSQEHQFQGKVAYFDLDTVITGNLDEIFEYDGKFALLKTDDLECEKNNRSGYNSSIMIWNSA